MTNSQPTYKRVLINALSNYGGYLVSLVVGFFMQAYLVRSLGSDQYAIIPLVVSCINYLNLLRLGTAMGMNRYISTAMARGDHEQISRIATSMFFFMAVLGAILMVAGAFLAWQFGRIFTIADDLQRTATIVMLLMTFNAAVQMPFGILGAAFVATQRYTWQNVINSAIAMFNALLTLGLLFWFGEWVVWVVAAQLFTALIRIGLEMFAVRRILPSFCLRASLFSRKAVAGVWSFSLMTFLSQIGVLLYWHTDNIIINKFSTPHDLTIYAVAVSMATYIYQLIQVPVSVLFPVVAGMEARGQIDRIPAVVYRGTRFCILVGLPFCILAAFFAEPFFRLYLGPEYSGAGKFVPVIMLSIFFSSSTCIIRQVPTAIGKPVFISILELAMAVLNVILTLIFVLKFRWGLTGVACGTAISVILKNGIVIPVYLRRILDISLTRLLYNVYIGVIPSIISGIILLGAINLLKITNIYFVLLVITGSTVVYLSLAYVFGLDNKDRKLIISFCKGSKLVNAFAKG